MKSGRTYEVFVNGKPIGLVGSTIQPLSYRRVNGYTKKFGLGVELLLIREIPIPDGYSEEDYNFRLKAAEAFDIATKKTYVEFGGLNKISPLIQALGKKILESERGRIGGRIGGKIVGRRNVESGLLARICIEGGRTSGSKNGLKTKEQKIGIFAPGVNRKGGRICQAKWRGTTEQKEWSARGARILNETNPSAVKSGGRIAHERHPELRENLRKMLSSFEHQSRASKAQSRESRSRRGRMGGHARYLLYGPVGTPESHRNGGFVGMCSRWKISKGKPCVCGRHSSSKV